MVNEEFMEKLRERVIKSFMDILILKVLKTGSILSGYDLLGLIHKEFGVLISPGSVYSMLYSLERNALIEGTWSRRKRVYSLTEEGEETVKAILGAKEELHRLIAGML